MRVSPHILVTLLLAMVLLPLRGYAVSVPSAAPDEPPCMMAMSDTMQQADDGCLQPGCDDCSSCVVCGHCAAGAATVTSPLNTSVSSAEPFLQSNTPVRSTCPPVDSPPPRLG